MIIMWLSLAMYRSMTEVRPISSRAGGFLPRTHGCALFTRGETQALAVTTLGKMSLCCFDCCTTSLSHQATHS